MKQKIVRVLNNVLFLLVAVFSVGYFAGIEVEEASATADTTAPTVTFDPLDSATGVAVNSNITITFNEAVRHTDDSVIDDISVGTLITLKDNTSDEGIAFDATIDEDNKVITINPTNDFISEQVVYVAIENVEDTSNNAITASSVTFTVKDENYIDPLPGPAEPNINSGVTLYRMPGDPRVYVIKNKKKHWIHTPKEFEANNYKWNEIQEISAELLEKYPDAEDLVIELLRAIGDYKVYKIENGKRRWIKTAGEFNAAGYKWKDIQEVSSETLASYQDAILSNLLRAAGDYKVYKIKNGKKLWIRTIKEFRAAGYSWGNVEEVAVEILDDYPDSE